MARFFDPDKRGAYSLVMRTFPLLPVLLATGTLLAHGALFAAERLEVPDAVDGDDLFDATAEVRFEYTRQSALITRENTQLSGNDIGPRPRSVDVKELEMTRQEFRVIPRLDIGIFRDLAIFFEWPVVLNRTTSMQFAEGTNVENSTLIKDQAPNPVRGIRGWDETEGNGEQSFNGGGFGFPARPYNAWGLNPQTGEFESVRAGLDQPIFGVRYSPLNNQRNPALPTVTLQADYNLGFLPITAQDPVNQIASAAEPGAVARGVHEFHLGVGMSKRYQMLDPYFLVDAWMPFTSSSAPVGYKPRIHGGVTMGMEIVPFEDLEKESRLAFDLGYIGHYFSEGRDYSEVSDLLGDLTSTSQYFRTGVFGGLHFRAFSYLSAHLEFSGTYDTEHVLTGEQIGQDLDQEGEEGFGLVELSEAEERNAFYNPVVDTVGRRLSVADSLLLKANVRLQLVF